MARPNPTQNSTQDVTNPDPDIIIEGGVLITMVEGQAPLDPARIWVKRDRITHIEKADNKSEYHGNAEIINARNCIIMPGLVNAHSHTAMTLFRGLADDLSLKEWLFEKIFPAESKHLRPETVYWGSLLGCLEMIASGTTTVIDGYFFQDDTIRAIHKSGLRGLIAQGVIDFPAPGVPNPEDNLAVGEEYIERWLGYSDLIKPGMFCHSPLTCSDKTLKRAMDISRDFSLPLQIHLAETLEEVNEIVNQKGKRPVHYMDAIGILDEGLIAAHAIHLSDDEMETLAARGVKTVHVPESNTKLCAGVARVSEMVQLGLTVGLGTDGCASNNNLDLFQEMDFAAKLGKVFTRNPVNMGAATVLKMVTSWGARLLGLEKEIGAIEVDKKADIIVIDLNGPHLVPLYNPLSTIVYSASGADVKDVIVNGRILLKDRTFLTLDPDKIIERVNAFSREIGH